MSSPVSVTTSATLIIDPTDHSDSPDGETLIHNNSSEVLFIGPTDAVTTTSGVGIPSGSILGVRIGVGRPVYGIVATGPADVRVARL